MTPEEERNFKIDFRKSLVNDAYFLIAKTRKAKDYYDFSKDRDFDEYKAVCNTLKWIEFALDEIEEIA